MGVIESIRRNMVALISLVVAIVALTFNSERADRTEYQRNIREASFAVLRELNQLQLLVDQAHYGSDLERGNPIVGWTRVNYVVDLATVIPAPVPEAAAQLHSTWADQVSRLGVSKEASETEVSASLESNQQISRAIKVAREAVTTVLLSLE